MADRKVTGLEHLRFVVVNPSGVAVSAHQHPDAAARFILTSAFPQDLEVVEI
jgi:hypothetical protein